MTSEGTVYDIAMPVLGGQGGAVRVGLLKAPLDREIDRQTLGLLALTGAISLLGAGVGFALGTFLGNRRRR